MNDKERLKQVAENLRRCFACHTCEGCPFFDMVFDDSVCVDELLFDAIRVIDEVTKGDG